MSETIELSLAGNTPGESEVLLRELEDVLRNASRDVEVKRIKANQTTMDLGTIIGVVVASGAATAVAKGIADWLRKRNNVQLVLKRKGVTFEASGLSGTDAIRLLKIITGSE